MCAVDPDLPPVLRDPWGGKVLTRAVPLLQTAELESSPSLLAVAVGRTPLPSFRDTGGCRGKRGLGRSGSREAPATQRLESKGRSGPTKITGTTGTSSSDRQRGRQTSTAKRERTKRRESERQGRGAEGTGEVCVRR